MIAKVDPTKEAKLYTLRHSRATFLAKCGWSETQLCLYFGWQIGSDQPKTYIHLSGRDLNQAISALYGNEQAQKQMKVILNQCIQCKEQLYPNAPFCAKCGHSTSDTYLKGIRKVENENEDIKSQLEKLIQPLREADKQNDSKWRFMFSMLESLTGQRIKNVDSNATGEHFSMSSLFYEEEFFSEEHQKQVMEKRKEANRMNEAWLRQLKDKKSEG